jgi:hypothetical protein
MADEKEVLPIFSNSFNSIEPNTARLITNYNDRVLSQSTIIDIGNASQLYDRRSYISNTIYKAIVVKTYPKNTPPIPESNLPSIINVDNFLQCRAVIPDLHSSISILPVNLSPQALNTDSEDQISIDLAPYFYMIGATESLNVGAIIEVQFDGGDYTIGKIVSIINPTPIIEASEISAQQAMEEGFSAPLTEYTNNTTGEGAQDAKFADKTSNNENCGKAGTAYPVKPCYTGVLEATGQNVTLHPDFWDEINCLLITIEENEQLQIKINSATRSKEKQLQLRKKRCPQAINSTTDLETMKWSELLKKYSCSDTTDTAAVSGPFASNHLIGLAVDFDMQINPCPTNRNSNDLNDYNKCRQGDVFKALQKHSGSKVINLPREPWHWSYNGK